MDIECLRGIKYRAATGARAGGKRRINKYRYNRKNANYFCKN